MTSTLARFYIFAFFLGFSWLLGNQLDAQDKPRAFSKSPLGFWKSIDDKKKKASAIIQISKIGKYLEARVVKVLDLERGTNPKCEKCTGKNKNRRLIGLKILKDMKQEGKLWSGGQILDPKNGKWYKCFIELQNGGRKMKVRGYIGFSLLGRTQHWYRVAKPP